MIQVRNALAVIQLGRKQGVDIALPFEGQLTALVGVLALGGTVVEEVGCDHPIGVLQFSVGTQLRYQAEVTAVIGLLRCRHTFDHRNAVLVHVDVIVRKALHASAAVRIAEGKLLTAAGVVAGRIDTLLLRVQIACITIRDIVIIEGRGVGIGAALRGIHQAQHGLIRNENGVVVDHAGIVGKLDVGTFPIPAAISRCDILFSVLTDQDFLQSIVGAVVQLVDIHQVRMCVEVHRLRLIQLAEFRGGKHLVRIANGLQPQGLLRVFGNILTPVGMVFRQIPSRGIKHRQARAAAAVRQHGKLSIILHRKCRVGIAAGHHNDLVALQRQGEGRDLLRLHLHAGLLGKVLLLGLKGRERDHRFRLRLRSVCREGRHLLPQLVQQLFPDLDLSRHAEIRGVNGFVALLQRQPPGGKERRVVFVGVGLRLLQGRIAGVRHGEFHVLRQGVRGQDRHGEGQVVVLIGKAPALRELAVLAVDVHGLSAGQGAGLIIAVVAVDMGLLAAEIPGVRRLVRAGAAQQGRILGIVEGLGGLAVQVALHHREALLRSGGGFGLFGSFRFGGSFRSGGLRRLRLGILPAGEDAHPVGLAVAVAVQEDQVAGDRALQGLIEEVQGVQRRAPGLRAGLHREGLLRRAGIVQAEGGKGQVPLPEGVAVPGAVAGVADVLPGVIHGEAALAGAVALLGQGDGQGVPVPVAGQVLGFPVLGVLRRVRVGPAGVRVGVLRLLADQHLLIAGVRVDMAHCHRDRAQCCGRLRRGGIAVRFGAAGVLRRGGLGRGFRRRVGRRSGLGVRFGHRVRDRIGLRRRVLRGSALAADQAGLVAILGMGVLLQAAGGLRRQGDGREDQRVGGAEDHHAGKDGNRLAPAAALFVAACHFLYCIQEKSSFSPCLLQSTGPNLVMGQTRKTMRPTICSSATQPMAVVRLSTEVARWSPMTNQRSSGT